MTRRRDDLAFEGFVVEARRFWMSDMWAALREDYERRSDGASVSTATDVERVLASSPTYACYAWLERHIQRTKYSGRYGLVRRFRDERPAGADTVDNLTLDPTLTIPDYYSAVDIHQHPGNLTDGPGAGLVYKASATSTQPGATGGYGLHERFAAWLGQFGVPRSVLDMGCGFGKSSITLAQQFPEAQVKGIDLSAPCLELAAVEGATAGLGNLAYRQADVRHAPFPEAAFDLVTSTMVLHELDESALRETLRESYRLVEPGGLVVHLDFRVKDPFLEFIHYGHSRRNNEPYMVTLNEMDIERELQLSGFTDVQTLPFEEVDGATRADWPTWRFPWTAFVARRPAA